MSALKIKEIPTPPGSDHKKVPHIELLQHEFTVGIIAPKGSGKTTTIINMLRMYKVC
jgi:Ni2+-binding GTPase involved in maturation of urease and hydrogenase